jgi:P27 family predicted phage terminase small subunit
VCAVTHPFGDRCRPRLSSIGAHPSWGIGRVETPDFLPPQPCPSPDCALSTETFFCYRRVMPHRKSNTLKLISGTARRDRQPQSHWGERLVSVPEPPAHLSDRAATEWRRLARELVEAGSLTGADLRALELLAETLALEAEMRALISAEGATIPAGEGGKKGHPALKIATDARAQAIRLLESFGLTPSSRHRVDRAPPPPADDSPWARLKALQGQCSNAPHSGDPARARGDKARPE